MNKKTNLTIEAMLRGVSFTCRCGCLVAYDICIKCCVTIKTFFTCRFFFFLFG